MLFERFRRPRWQHSNPEIRRQAVTQLAPDDPEAAQRLHAMAEADPAPLVRLAAVRRLTDLEQLRRRMAADADATVREASRARYRQILTAGQGEHDLAARIAELDVCADTQVLAHVARSGREEALRSAALSRLDDPFVLEEAALHDPVARIRLQAVERLYDAEALARVAKLARARDRRVTRIAQQRHRRLQETERDRREREAEADRICAALSELSSAETLDPTVPAERERLCNRWRRLGELDDIDRLQRFQELLSQLDERLEAESPPTAVATPTPNGVAEAPHGPERHTAPIAASPQPPMVGADEPAATGDAPPNTETQPSGEDEPTTAMVQARLTEVETALEAGELRPARRGLERARAMVNTMTRRPPSTVERRLTRAAAKVAELRDWRGFAVLPKQESLCEAMEALEHDQELSPPERAARIKSLRGDWKATGGSDSARSRELWARFNASADRAFEPCRVWFDQQAQRRRDNLDGRERVCEQLATFLALPQWTQRPLDELVRIREVARNDWQSFTPVDRDALKPLSRRFEAMMDQLTEAIETSREAAREAKAQLVKDAEALVEAPDAEAAAQRAKALQAQWRKAGDARPGDERGLWKAFRAACDRIFERRDAGRAEVRAGEQARVAEGEALCEHIEALADDESRDDPVALRDEAAALRDRLRRLPMPSQRDGKSVNLRLERAMGAVERRAEELTAAFHWRRLDAVESAAQLCLRRERGEPVERSPEELLVQGVSPELAQSLRERWARADAVGSEETEAASRRRRTICVRLEILAGNDSPAEDESLRMQLQVERLSLGMVEGGQRETPAAETWRLITEWYGLSGEDAELRSRFHEAVGRLL